MRRPIKLSSRTCRTERSLEKKWKRPGMRSAWKRERAASQFHFREGKRLRRMNTTRSLFIPARKNHNFRNIRDTVSRASWCRVRRISLCAPVTTGSNSFSTNIDDSFHIQKSLIEHPCRPTFVVSTVSLLVHPIHSSISRLYTVTDVFETRSMPIYRNQCPIDLSMCDLAWRIAATLRDNTRKISRSVDRA